jgi:hypothetical protein
MLRRGWILDLAVLILGGSLLAGCVPRPSIVSPQDLSAADPSGQVPIEIQLGSPLGPSGKLRVTLLTGIDDPPTHVSDVSPRLSLSSGIATGALSAADLRPGHNTLFVAIDADGDGRSENVASSTFTWAPPTLEAAACRKVITPNDGVISVDVVDGDDSLVPALNHTHPIYMAGFDTREAAGIHDHLWARGVVLESRGTKIAMVTLDLIGYFNNEVQTIRSLVDPALGLDTILVTSTHVHEGPDAMGLWGPDAMTSGVDPGYLDYVNDAVVACIEEANANLVPAEIKFATGSTVGASLEPEPDLVADGEILHDLVIPGDLLRPAAAEDRVVQGDAGPIRNPTLPSYQIRRLADHQVIATAVNFASHPESLGSSNPLLSSDFPHYMRKNLEARYGGVALYVSADLGVLQGPLDVDVPDPVTGKAEPRRSFEFAETMGNLLAQRAVAALDAVTHWDSFPEIEHVSSGNVFVRVENPFFIAGAAFNIFGRRQVVRLPDGRRGVNSEAHALRIGSAQFAITPNELDPQVGNLYRAAMTNAEHRFLLGLANDELGYQMPAAKFDPSCHQCFPEIALSDDETACPLYNDIDPPPLRNTIDCSTVFINNIGAGADPLFQGIFQGLLQQLND